MATIQQIGTWILDSPTKSGQQSHKTKRDYSQEFHKIGDFFDNDEYHVVNVREWLSNLTPEQLEEVIRIDNPWFSSMLQNMFSWLIKCRDGKFKVNKNNENFESFENWFVFQKSDIKEMQLKTKVSDQFESSLRFSGQNFAQVTLSREAYQDFPTLLSTLDSITTYQIFRLPLRAWWDYKSKVWVTELPNWINEAEAYTLSSWAVAFFEKQIWLSYWRANNYDPRALKQTNKYFWRYIEPSNNVQQLMKFWDKLEKQKKFQIIGNIKSLQAEFEIEQKQRQGPNVRQNYVFYTNSGDEQYRVFRNYNCDVYMFRIRQSRHQYYDQQKSLEEFLSNYENTNSFFYSLTHSSLSRMGTIYDQIALNIYNRIQNAFTEKIANELIKIDKTADPPKSKKRKRKKSKKKRPDAQKEIDIFINNLIGGLFNQLYDSVDEIEIIEQKMSEQNEIINKFEEESLSRTTTDNQDNDNVTVKSMDDRNFESIRVAHNIKNFHSDDEFMEKSQHCTDFYSDDEFTVVPIKSRRRNVKKACKKTSRRKNPQKKQPTTHKQEQKLVVQVQQRRNQQSQTPKRSSIDKPGWNKPRNPPNKTVWEQEELETQYVKDDNEFPPLLNDKKQKQRQYTDLHHQIQQFGQLQVGKMTCMQNYINHLISLFNMILNQLYPGCQVSLFGSYSTWLAIDSSDIDLVVTNLVIVSRGHLEDLIKQTGQILQTNTDWIKSCNPIHTASVPVIKLTVDGQYFDMNLKSEIQLDLTFDYKVSNQHHAGLAARDLIREIINLYPPLQNLVLVIKTFLSSSNLNSPYHGGLSSYSLVIWTVAYLNALEKQEQNPDLGELLLGFLKFYGTQFNSQKLGINILSGCSYFSRDPRSIDQVITIDPLQNWNNTTRSTYAIKEVQDKFSQIYHTLIYQVQKPRPKKDLLDFIISRLSSN